MSVCSSQYWSIAKLDDAKQTRIQQRIDSKTKPPGSLGKLETLAARLALIQSQHHSDIADIDITQPHILTFAGDHGIARQGVSIAPPEVTQQMVQNFLSGGAAINCFCRVNQVTLTVIDAGMLAKVGQARQHYLVQPVGPGTADFSVQAAMTEKQCEQALTYGKASAEKVMGTGSNILGFGEMGIGNSSSAAAMLAALAGLSAKDTVGLGTGISAQQLQLKIALVDQALKRVRHQYAADKLTPFVVMQQLGGFEIVQMVGAMLATAQAGRTILVDGFISSVAALLATKIAPASLDYMLFAHCSAEQAYQLILELLAVEPLVDLGMRLGEGTGAALAVPMLRAAAEFFNSMATFASANIEI